MPTERGTPAGGSAGAPGVAPRCKALSKPIVTRLALDAVCDRYDGRAGAPLPSVTAPLSFGLRPQGTQPRSQRGGSQFKIKYYSYRVLKNLAEAARRPELRTPDGGTATKPPYIGLHRGQSVR